MNKYILILVAILLISSCRNDRKLDVLNLNKLILYFQTENIDLNYKDGICNIIVSNSKLILNSENKGGYTWLNAEPYGSFAALIVSDQIMDPLKQNDSVKINIHINNRQESYTYRVADLKLIRKYIAVCDGFCATISKEKYKQATAFLGGNILQNVDSTKLYNYLMAAFCNSNISKADFIAFTTDKNAVGIYMNVYFQNGSAQTYIFTFLLKGDGKIAGIKSAA